MSLEHRCARVSGSSRSVVSTSTVELELNTSALWSLLLGSGGHDASATIISDLLLCANHTTIATSFHETDARNDVDPNVARTAYGLNVLRRVYRQCSVRGASQGNVRTIFLYSSPPFFVCAVFSIVVARSVVFHPMENICPINTTKSPLGMYFVARQ